VLNSTVNTMAEQKRGLGDLMWTRYGRENMLCRTFFSWTMAFSRAKRVHSTTKNGAGTGGARTFLEEEDLDL